ncbi:hypothetical protein BRD13_05045 [Halobacteriales archaeon SW_5_70_135]|nr:MAG: hypothetical protein BRD13_05045 [Halobacteriales archaeon SW_5_70_135]
MTVSLNGLPSSYTVSGVSGDVVASSDDNTRAQLATDEFQVPAGETATVTFTIQVPDSAEAGDVSWTALAEAGQSEDTDSVTSTLTVEEGEPEPEPPEEQPLDENTQLVDGGTFFVGQTLVTDAYDSNDNVRLEDGDGNFESDVEVTDGTATIDTGQLGLSAGNYQLTSPTGPTIEFELAEQDYSVNPGTANVTNAGDGSSAEITVDSNRNGYVHVLSSPDVDAETLAGLLSPPDNLEASIQDADGDDENEVVLTGGSIQDVVEADFGGVSAGEYTINFEVFDTGVSDSITVNVEDTVAGDAEFGTVITREQRGDVAEIPVELENTDQATVFLGSEEVNYEVRLEVTDGNDDDVVTIEWNTDSAGQDETATFDVANNDDSVTAERLVGGFSDADRRLTNAGYPLNVTVEGVGETDVGTVNLQNPSDDVTLEIRRAQGTVDNEDISTDNTNAASSVASGDKVVARVSGIQSVFGYVDNSGDPPAQGVDISITESSLQDNELADEVDVSNLELRASDDDDQLLLIGTTNEFEIGSTYDVTFSIDSGANPYFTEDVEATQSVTFRQRSASLDVPSDELRLQRISEATVSGTTTVADGTTLTVTIRSTNQENPILESQQVEVENGTFAVDFDLSDGVAGQSISVTVREGGVTRASESGVVTEPANVDASGASINADGRLITGVSAFLPKGGFVTVHDSTLQDGAVIESVRGTSKYFGPGQVNDIQIALDGGFQGGTSTIIAMAHLDTNGNNVYDFVTSGGAADGPYVVDGSPVISQGEVTVPTPTPTTTTSTPTPTTTTSTPTPTTETPTPTTTTETTTTEGGDSPGFGVAVALIALLAAALLATRRRDE